MNKILCNLFSGWESDTDRERKRAVHENAGQWLIRGHVSAATISLHFIFEFCKLSKIAWNINANMKCIHLSSCIWPFNLLANMFEYWFTTTPPSPQPPIHFVPVSMVWNDLKLYAMYINKIYLLIVNTHTQFIPLPRSNTEENGTKNLRWIQLRMENPRNLKKNILNVHCFQNYIAFNSFRSKNELVKNTLRRSSKFIIWVCTKERFNNIKNEIFTLLCHLECTVFFSPHLRSSSISRLR